MLRFILRRLGLTLGILFLLSVLMYWLLDIALDPLSDLRSNPSTNRDFLIQVRRDLLNLDAPWFVRYWDWLTSFVTGDFGLAWRTSQRVNDIIPGAVATSIQLVLAASVIAMLLGVTIGLVSALRQYTTFDYTITLISFVLYSLPIFWVAVLLKQYLAIGVNDYLNQPTMNWPVVIALSVLSALFWLGILGGDARKRWIVLGSAFAVTLAVLCYMLLSGWMYNPSLGIGGVAVLGLGLAVAVTAVFAGMNNRRALYSALTTAAIGIVLYFPVQWFFRTYVMSWPVAFGLLAIALAVGVGVGWLFGGPDRLVSMRGSALVAFLVAVFVFVDRVLQGWAAYGDASAIRGRPIATIGAETPNLGGDFWFTQLDKWTHLLLPSIALVLISFATYTRYQRGATLEVLNQDYIRTARAKGLSERVVIVRHALRNALMPLASIIPVDFISLIGGAVLTETIFSWAGMGSMFIESLQTDQIDPVMFYVMLTGALAMVANLVADFLYAVIDPRIRVNA